MSQVAAAVQRIIAPISEDLLAVDREVIDDLQSDIPLIKKISDYIVTAGGKRMRPIVLMLIARALGYQGKEHIFLATMIEYVHTASLLHDDVVDESDLRRGKPTAGFKWGNAAAILTGLYVFSCLPINGSHPELTYLRNCCRRREQSFRRRSHPAAQHP